MLVVKELVLIDCIYLNSLFIYHIFYSNASKYQLTTQLTFNCSKSTIETLERAVKYVQKLKIKTLEGRQ